MHSALSLLLLASSSLGSAKKHTIKHKHTHRGTEPPLGDMLLATAGSYVTDIAKCPPLKPRDSPPTSVHDLKTVVLMTSRWLWPLATPLLQARSPRASINPDNKNLNWVEWRGVSYAGGGDPGAVTMPNLLKHYNSTLVGGAVGYNPGYEICFGSGCPVGPVGWNKTVDVLNAGQSGAYASNLLHEAQDYLAPQVKAMNISQSRYKFLSFQIGANDVCQLCAAADAPMGPATKSDFENNIRATLEYVRQNIPNTLVNLFGAWQLTDIYSCIAGQGDVGEFTRGQMDRLVQQYNTVLQNIVADYKAKNYKDFAVIWQPPNLPFKNYPIQAVSSVDCFHPSSDAHARIAAGLWNRLTLDTTARAAPFTWEETPTFRCLEESDRIQT
ncbi:hypothetical protein RHS04_00071 [Rhizoctonia solani]|uniref:SGNH hydrolase-type esterase domain-containing protein n=1 Tax=Rhizoctonia solani TaxID=456999 RepID=A0A8H7LPA6_9AGAM|nr:hypothetical protein RHS04_00071 [Rhizoctonia solani]